jgi:hypothetical protein
MRFHPLTDTNKKTRAIVYANKHCPSFDPCPDDVLEKWIGTHSPLIYEIKEMDLLFGYVTFSLKGEVLFVETLFIFPEQRKRHDFISAVVAFANNVAKENDCSIISCDTVHPSLAKILVEKHAFDLTYTFRKNVI